jgi:hypothetical protein
MAAESSASAGAPAKSGIWGTFENIFGLIEQGFRIAANAASAFGNKQPYTSYPQTVSPPSAAISNLIGDAAKGAMPGIQYLPYVVIGGIVLILVVILGRRR